MSLPVLLVWFALTALWTVASIGLGLVMALREPAGRVAPPRPVVREERPRTEPTYRFRL